MIFESEAVALIERARAATGYDARLNGLADGFWAAQREVRALDRQSAPGARPLLYAAITGPVPAGCHPACCQASYVRATVLQGRRAVLHAWARLDPAAAETFTTELLDGLMVPHSKAIAIVTAQMCAAAPAAAVKHADRLVHHGRTHPKWQVKLAIAQAVRVALKAGARPAGARPLARRLQKDPRVQLQREGDRVMRLLEPPPDGATRARSRAAR